MMTITINTVILGGEGKNLFTNLGGGDYSSKYGIWVCITSMWGSKDFHTPKHKFLSNLTPLGVCFAHR